MPPASDRQLVGRTLGGFVLRERIGEGGFGVVFRAEQTALGREAVVKLLKGAHLGDPGVVARFAREAQLAVRLDHPYAAHIYETGAEADGVFWIAMELVRGTPLNRLLEAQERLSPERLIPLLDRICEVVHTAHEQGIIHRDLKPANVMVLTRAGRLLPKLLDLGVAKLVESARGVRTEVGPRAPGPAAEPPGDPSADTQAAAATDDSGSTQAGSVLGSPPYMAPELWDGRLVDGRTDQYALAVMTYEALTGHLPFLTRDFAGAHRHTPFPSLGSDLPAALDAVLARAAAKNIDDRYPTVLAFAAALRAAAGLDVTAESRPQLAAPLRAKLLERAPEPICDAVLALERARSAREACDAVWALRSLATRWLGVVALSALPSAAGTAELACQLLRRELDDAEWLELARTLARGAPSDGPLGDLVDVLAGNPAAPLAALAALARTDGNEEASRALLALAMPLLGAALVLFDRLGRYRLVVSRGDHLEEWTGTRRLALDGPIPDEPEGRPLLVDENGETIARLWPLAQVAPPAPGARDELFLLAGVSRRAAMLTASGGFSRRAAEIAAWLARRYPQAATAGAEPSTEPRAYVGLTAFTAGDAQLYVGREREVEACVNRLRVQSLLVVAGPSGAGKSSFVHAGVIPALPADWRTLSLRPGHAPLATLAARLAPALGHRDAAVLSAGLARDPSSIQAFLASAAGTPLVVIVDQLEELFTLCPDEAARAAFAEALAGMVSFGGPVRLVCTVRDDFLVRVERLPAMRQRVAQALHLIATPAPDELRRILVEPARRAGYSFDDAGLPDEMVSAVADRPGALALLSFTAARLWETRDRERRLLLAESYRAMGGVAGALGQHAEETLARLPADERGLLRVVFRHLVTPEGTRAQLGTGELAELCGGDDRARSVIEALTAARLLSVGETEGGEIIEVVHEALLDAWPRAATWRREDEEGARVHADLRAAARAWTARRRPPRLLYVDDALHELRRWLARDTPTLTAGEAAFADASLSAAARGRRLRALAVATALVALAGLSLVFYRLYDRARTQGRLVEERSAVAERQRDELMLLQARSLVDRDPTAALAWLKRYMKSGTSWREVQAVAVDAWSRGVARRVLRGHEGGIFELAYAPDGRTLASAGYDHSVRLWDPGGGGGVRVLSGHTGEINDVAFARDGKRLVSASDDGTVRVWSVAGGDGRTLAGHRGIVNSAAFFSDGERVVSGGTDGTIRVWDLASGAATLLASGQAGAIKKLALSPDDKLLASCGEGPDVWLWDVASHAARRLSGHSARVTNLVFSPTGQQLASVDTDGHLRLWEAPEWRAREIAVQPGTMRGLAFSPDGTRLASGNYDETVTLWELSGGRRVLRGHQGPVLGVAFSPDGKQLASGGVDRRIRLWEVPESRRAYGGFRLAQGEAMAFSPDEEKLAYTAGNGVRVVDGDRVIDLAGGSNLERCVVFSPDGARVAALDSEGWVRMWDAGGGAPRATLGRSGGEVSIAFTRDGGRVLFPLGPAVVMWDPATGDLVKLEGPHDVARWVRALPGAAAAVAGNELWRWDLETRSGRKLGGGRSYISGFEVAPDGRAMATGYHDGSIQLWNAEGVAGELLSGHTTTVVPLAFSADARVLVSGSNDKTVRVWRGAGIEPLVFEGHRTLVRRVAVAPDASFIVSAGNDDTIRTWDLADGSSGAFVGHAAVLYLALSPTGTKLAAAGADGEVRLWDPAQRVHVPVDPQRLVLWLDEATSAEVADVE